ncbi:hypothetical protein GOP47_0029401 [Adiantum capillus-veneris]|nr:hypothetical protein GOP47_0029401 [Adiantum capillus-veneris]
MQQVFRSTFLNSGIIKATPKVLGPFHFAAYATAARTTDAPLNALITLGLFVLIALLMGEAAACMQPEMSKPDSPRARRQFYSLAADVHQQKLDVPRVELFDDSIPYADDDEVLEFSESRIRHIIQVNSFSGF